MATGYLLASMLAGPVSAGVDALDQAGHVLATYLDAGIVGATARRLPAWLTRSMHLYLDRRPTGHCASRR
jgi:hypothetical protein